MPSTLSTGSRPEAAAVKPARWGRVPPYVLTVSLGLAATASIARAQVAPTPAPTQQAAVTSSSDADAIKQREQELEAARAQQKSAADLQEKLKAEIAAIGQDRSKLNQQLIDIAARVRGIEGRIDEDEARLRPLDAREAQVRGSLEFAPLRNHRSARGPATRRPARTAGAAGASRGRA